jgi:hypothetical protein
MAWHTLLAALVSLGALLPASVYGVSAELPGAIQLKGATVELASCGVRRVLWLDFYSAGLYLQRGAPLKAALDPAKPAALAVKVLNWRNFPDDMPGKWRRALEGVLDEQAMARVLAAYDDLRDGDLLLLAYAPGAGARLELNGRVLAAARGHRIIERMLHVWAGDDPLADTVRELALKHACPGAPDGLARME